MKNNNHRASTNIVATSLLFASTNLWATAIKISGELMLDHDTFDAGYIEDGVDASALSELRRAQLSFKTTWIDDWKAKLKIDFAGDDVEVKDAYLQYSGFDWANVTLGQHKEPFSLEKLSSSSDAIMIERSLSTTALAPGRSIGVSVNGSTDALNWQLGYFQEEDEPDTHAITGRVTWLPYRQGNEFVHLGLAFSERDLNGGDFRVNEKLEVHGADSLFEGEQLLGNKASLQGLEFLWQQSGFTTMAEWQQATVTDINNAEYNYQGGYVQLSYQFSGNNRAYKQGKLGAVTTPGWEIISRYSQLALVEESREAHIYSLGLNYIVNKNLKFMADYIKARQIETGNELDFSDAISLRVQYSF